MVETSLVLNKTESGASGTIASAQQDFLPGLSHLEYHTKCKEECVEFWDVIPDLFDGCKVNDCDGSQKNGDQDMKENNGGVHAKRHTRPLKKLSVTFQQP